MAPFWGNGCKGPCPWGPVEEERGGVSENEIGPGREKELY